MTPTPAPRRTGNLRQRLGLPTPPARVEAPAPHDPEPLVTRLARERKLPPKVGLP